MDNKINAANFLHKGTLSGWRSNLAAFCSLCENYKSTGSSPDLHGDHGLLGADRREQVLFAQEL